MKVFCFSCNHINVLFWGRLLALIQSVHFYRQLFNAFLPFPNKQLVIGVFSLSLLCLFIWRKCTCICSPTEPVDPVLVPP